ncbi:MAG: PEP-CTERM sorting domain-containing protein [Betaproteobacteria bacterium]|nr:PEP-CTERM sorting domain-containing protein [Betaproteobacteria bacterium]
MKKLLKALAAFSVVLTMGAAQGALIDRGGGLIYDDILKVTWLSNANLGAGSSFDDGVSSVDGLMSWQNAMNWAFSLSFYDSVRGVYYNDWRLPHALPANGVSYAYTIAYDGSTDQGWNITGTQAELSHMFYVGLGNIGTRDTAGNYPSGAGLVDDPANPNDESLFVNIGSAYWTATTYNGPDVSTVPHAWDFAMAGGAQVRGFKLGADHYAWAVRDGDVATIPEPATLALVGAALLGAVATRGRKSVSPTA